MTREVVNRLKSDLSGILDNEMRDSPLLASLGKAIEGITERACLFTTPLRTLEKITMVMETKWLVLQMIGVCSARLAVFCMFPTATVC